MVGFGPGVMAYVPGKDQLRWQLHLDFARSCGCGKAGGMMASTQFAPDTFSRRRISLADIDTAVPRAWVQREVWETRNPLASIAKSGCIWPGTSADGVPL